MQCCFAMMQWCIVMPGEFGPRLSDHAITDDHNTSITLYQRIKKHSSGWLSATEQCCTTVRKYVRKHYLFKNAKFPRTKLEENCELRGANHVQREIYEHIFPPNRGYRCLLSFKYSLSARNWIVYEQLMRFSLKKNRGPLIPNNEITSWSGGIDENWYREITCWAFNSKQWDHELIRWNRRKLMSGNSLVVIYISATEVTSNTRTHKEHLFICWRNYCHAW